MMDKSQIICQCCSRRNSLWNDESGEISIMSLVLICTMIAIGATVGLTALRDQVTLEFGDVAVAIENLDQSFEGGPYGSYVDPGPATPPLIGLP
jgi:hypothetical protein